MTIRVIDLMTIGVIDRWKNKYHSKVKVRLAQRRGIYLCYVYEEKERSKILLDVACISCRPRSDA